MIEMLDKIGHKLINTKQKVQTLPITPELFLKIKLKRLYL